MQISFWGVRGSAPSPGRQYSKYGGNTPCIYLSYNKDWHIILDAGTGIIPLGEKLVQDDKPIYLLLSHNHWDHIQGFPFFLPAYQANRKITIIPAITEPNHEDAILQQMAGSYFPIGASQLKANIEVNSINDISAEFELAGLKISRCILNHPQKGCAYKICSADRCIIYCTDNELTAVQHQYTNKSHWRDFFADCDLLIHDAQYVEQDFPDKADWGHSCFIDVIDIALAAKVKTLCLFSHDHRRTDNEIDLIFTAAKRLVAKKGGRLNVVAAKEADILNIGNGTD